MVQGGSTLIKYLLFFFNFIFVITGLALIIVGALVHSYARTYLDFIGQSSISAAVLVIVLGVIVFFVAFFGCCGAIKENHCMVLTFSVLLFILFIMELAAGGAGYAFRNELPDIVHKGLRNAYNSWNSTRTDRAAQKGLDEIQNDFHCCGVEGVGDFWNETEGGFPHYNDSVIALATCCPDTKLDTNGTCHYVDAYKTGCVDGLLNFLKDKAAMVGGCAIGVAVIEILGVVFACVLARAIRKEYEVV